MFLNLNIGFCNINSIFNKMNILSDFLTEYKLDIFGVAETWLLPDTPVSFVSIYGYYIARSNTPGNVRKHGVCVYIRKHINFISISPIAVMFALLIYLTLTFMWW